MSILSDKYSQDSDKNIEKVTKSITKALNESLKKEGGNVEE